MAGISLRLQAAQIINLVGPGQRDAASFGFGGQDGYVAPESSDDERGAEDSGPDGNPQDF